MTAHLMKMCVMSPVKETSWISCKMGLLLVNITKFVFTTRVRKDEIPSEIRILVLLAHGHRNTESVREFTKECNYG